MATPYYEQNDPSCIYGYISLVDPDTEQKHLLMSQRSLPPIPHGYPDFAVVFRQVDGEETRQIHFRAGTGLRDVKLDPNNPNRVIWGRESAVAYLYYVTLVQDRAETGEPRYVIDRTQLFPAEMGVEFLPTRTIRYNPDQWRFHTIEMGPYHFTDPDGTRNIPDAEPYEPLSGWLALPLHPREEPFSDLPDMTEPVNTW